MREVIARSGMTWPRTRNVPLSGLSAPAAMRMRVVLPEPLGPSSPKMIPGGIDSVIRSSATIDPKRRET